MTSISASRTVVAIRQDELSVLYHDMCSASALSPGLGRGSACASVVRAGGGIEAPLLFYSEDRVGVLFYSLF